MAATILKRLLAAVPVLVGLSILVFAIMAMIPGDTALAILGSYATPENVARLNAQLGLDRSLPEQYLIWAGNLLHGDLGQSYILNRPVLDEVAERFSATLILAGTALVLASLLGLAAVAVLVWWLVTRWDADAQQRVTPTATPERGRAVHAAARTVRPGSSARSQGQDDGEDQRRGGKCVRHAPLLPFARTVLVRRENGTYSP